MSLFVDTSAFLTILDADDPNNAAATAVWTDSISGGETLLTTNYVILETVSVLHRRHGVSAVRWFVDEMLPVVRIEWVDQSAHSIAIKTVLAGSRNGPSVVDCVSFETIQRLNVTSVLAYDGHFENRGFVLAGQ